MFFAKKINPRKNNFGKEKPLGFFRKMRGGFFLIFLFLIILLALPQALSFAIKHRKIQPTDPFPVTVYPKNKQIIENEKVNNYLEKNHLLIAGANNANSFLWNTFENIANYISEIPLLKNLGAVGSERFITLKPGLRKEEVAEIFAKKLNWNNTEKKEFLLPSSTSSILLSEGTFFPDIYALSASSTPKEARELISARFSLEVLSHYSSSTEAIVPLKDVLIIASIIQKETITNDGMRLISGILWNRLFANMKLQVDATLQYAEADSKKNSPWWPSVEPADKFIKSPYNTYINVGLPPEPIASPSVVAILAALNPINTTCLFYFNDKDGEFHCSETYEEHKKLLREYY